MPIHLRADFRIRLPSKGASIGEGSITVPIGNETSALVRINGFQLIVEAKLPISAELLAWLRIGQPKVIGEWPQQLAEEIAGLHERLESAARLPVGLAKYFLGFSDIADDLLTFGKLEWSTDLSEWHRFPFRITMTGWSSSQMPISGTIAGLLQDDIVAAVRPFLSMRHLHRAMAESIPRFKWIEATIAAELAIKEALLVVKPQLGTLLLEAPSPPLAKLYGPVMKEYLGEVSPFRNALIAGSERRNKLVHRPEDQVITLSEADAYVATVERAIFHLLYLVYPSSKILPLAKAAIRGG